MYRFRSTHAAALAALFVLVAVALPSTARDVEIEEGDSVESVVREVLGLKHVVFGGRLFVDWMEWGSFEQSLETAFSEDAFLGGTEFRTARVQMSGEVTERLAFFIDYDFSGGDVKLKDAYMEFRQIDHLGNLRVGHIREPFGLEGLTSSKYTTFMESALTSAFYPWRNTGFMLHNVVADERATWAAGVFRDADAFGAGSGEDELSYTARVTGTPWLPESGGGMFHLGASYSHRKPNDGVARFKASPENHMGPVLADTGEVDVYSETLLGFEAAVALGSLLVQGEYVRASMDRVEGVSWKDDSGRGARGDLVAFSGYYIQASWTFTGESRVFSKGVPARLKPTHQFEDDGRGAFELAVRYSGVDLTNTGAGVEGGELTDMTIGFNWYTSANSRVMLNYVISDYAGPDVEERGDGVEGSTSALLTRFQIDF